MPSSVRKSSVGLAGRRGPQKAHIPFRADDLEHGKKTGLAVTYVDHKSDDFEPFSEVMQQADGRTPARKKRKSTVTKKTVVEEEVGDEDGEMSMELDNSTASPLAYFTNTRNPPSPSPSNNSTRRLGQSSSRPLPRSSDVDFDSVPSPRASRHRQSTGTAGPSNLSKSTVAYASGDDDDDGGGFDDYQQPENDYSPETPRRTSFSAIDQDDDEEDEEVEVAGVSTPIQQPSSARKGKGRAAPSSPSPPIPASDEVQQDQYQDQDMGGMEDDIAQGLDDVEMGSGEEEVEPEEEEEEEPPMKKSKNAKEKKAKAPVKEKKPKKIVEIPHEASPPPGVRRGLRHRYRPLDWWRQERVVYGRRDSGISFVPHIKEIIRIPQEDPQPLGAKGKRKRTRGKSESKGADKEGTGENEVVTVLNPEEGWDDDTDPSGVVVDYTSKEEVSRRIAFTAKMVIPKAAANNDWFFQKVFGDGEFIAAGQLIIPPKGRKPSKGTKDNTYVFYVIEGAINLKVHNTTLVLATGAMFLVPRGNTYFIENICDRDAKLFFTQARKVSLDDEDGAPAVPRRSSDSMPRRPSVSGGAGSALQRSSSAGARLPAGGVNGAAKRRAMSTR